MLNTAYSENNHLGEIVAVLHALASNILMYMCFKGNHASVLGIYTCLCF